MQDTPLTLEETYRIAIRLLSKQDYSIYKLTQKLKARGSSDEVIESIIQELLEKKYLREDYYIESRIKGLMKKEYSPSYIQYKLSKEHLVIPIQTIEELFLEHNYTQEDQVCRLIKKKIDSISKKITSENKSSIIHKISKYLESKGHSQAMTLDHIKQLLS
jgi:SOS response regulatory protein OraA/RecX